LAGRVGDAGGAADLDSPPRSLVSDSPPPRRGDFLRTGDLLPPTPLVRTPGPCGREMPVDMAGTNVTAGEVSNLDAPLPFRLDLGFFFAPDAALICVVPRPRRPRWRDPSDLASPSGCSPRDPFRCHHQRQHVSTEMWRTGSTQLQRTTSMIEYCTGATVLLRGALNSASVPFSMTLHDRPAGSFTMVKPSPLIAARVVNPTAGSHDISKTTTSQHLTSPSWFKQAIPGASAVLCCASASTSALRTVRRNSSAHHHDQNEYSYII